MLKRRRQPDAAWAWAGERLGIDRRKRRDLAGRRDLHDRRAGALAALLRAFLGVEVADQHLARLELAHAGGNEHDAVRVHIAVHRDRRGDLRDRRQRREKRGRRGRAGRRGGSGGRAGGSRARAAGAAARAAASGDRQRGERGCQDQSSVHLVLRWVVLRACATQPAGSPHRHPSRGLQPALTDTTPPSYSILPAAARPCACALERAGARIPRGPGSLGSGENDGPAVEEALGGHDLLHDLPRHEHVGRDDHRRRALCALGRGAIIRRPFA